MYSNSAGMEPSSKGRWSVQVAVDASRNNTHAQDSKQKRQVLIYAHRSTCTCIHVYILHTGALQILPEKHHKVLSREGNAPWNLDAPVHASRTVDASRTIHTNKTLNRNGRYSYTRI